MTCFHPLKAWWGEVDGKRRPVFSPKFAYVDLPPHERMLKLPCNQCIGCRLERSRQWAMRCVFEASLYAENSFVTLTYDDDHLPKDLSLDRSAWPEFMKRLRYYLDKEGKSVRYFHAGEYGETLGRPHYHGLLFGYDFPDKYLWTIRNGNRLFRSPFLEKVWPFGFSSVGSATFESAAYVARYCLKKITGDVAEDYYTFVDLNTGEVFTREPEYATMSRRPGIAKEWYEQYKSDVYPFDRVVIRGDLFLKPPRYFDHLYQLEFPYEFSKIKSKRSSFAKENSRTSFELANLEYIQMRKLGKLPRVLL